METYEQTSFLNQIDATNANKEIDSLNNANRMTYNSYNSKNDQKPYHKKQYSDGRQTYPRRTLPNKAFDQEYMTEWAREVRFLADKGIRYTYVKRTPKYGVSQFKYTKTPALFAALVEFYSQVETEQSNVVSPNEVQELLKESGISLMRKGNGSFKFVKIQKPDTEDDTE